MLLCVNPFEAPSAVTLSVLRQLVHSLLSELAEGGRSISLVFSGICGSGKSFTADQLLVKVFQTVQKTEWLQDLRKYWQVSSVVLKALGCAATQSNRDASRIVRSPEVRVRITHHLSLSSPPPPPPPPPKGRRMVDFHFKGLQITKVKINCYFLDQVALLS